MHDFWDGPEKRRTCRGCGHVIQRAGAIRIMRNKVKPAKHDTSDKRPTRAMERITASRLDPGAQTPHRGKKGRGRAKAKKK